MKPDKSFYAFFSAMASLALCFACNNSQQQPPQPQKVANEVPPKPASSDPTCRGNCEDVAEIKIIHPNGPGKLDLVPSEKTSLINAMKATPPESSGKTHIHADVVDGALKFSPEAKQDTSHVTGVEPKITMSTGKAPEPSLPVNIVASPAASKLLLARTKRP